MSKSGYPKQPIQNPYPPSQYPPQAPPPYSPPGVSPPQYPTAPPPNQPYMPGQPGPPMYNPYPQPQPQPGPYQPGSSYPQHPAAAAAYPQAHYQQGPPQVVYAGNTFDSGARFDGVAQPSIPPPPPGVAPTGAQLYAMQGNTVIGTQKPASWLTGGTGGGTTFW